MPTEDLFLRACRREPTERTPVWFMRQAGRYQASYRELRRRHGILEICREPELAARVTKAAVDELEVDAAILFSDIVVPLAAVGVPLRIEDGVGPVIDRPVRSVADVDALRVLEPEGDVPEVLETVGQLAKELDRPLIGFAGAPFTLASYLVEGGPSKSFARTKALMLGDPPTWGRLMETLAASTQAYLRAQVEAGAAAVQLFDSWAGALSSQDYEAFVAPHTRTVLEGLAPLGAPRIHFAVGASHLLGPMARAGADVVGVDWRVGLDHAWDWVGHDLAIQGNLDPAALLAPADVLEGKVLDVLRRAGGSPGHVFNLGHGVLPQTDPGALRRVVQLVRERTAP